MNTRLVSVFRAIPIFGIVVFCFACKPAESQTQSRPSLIPDEPTCPRCVIRMRKIATIGDADGAGSFSQMPIHVVATSRGHYIVEGRPLAQVFAANGQFVSIIGKTGQGPGEFSVRSLPIPIPGDSLLVFDPRNRRASVFGPGFRFVRQIQLPASIGKARVIQWPDTMAVLGLIQSREVFGMPVHLLRMSTGIAQVIASGELGDFLPNDTRFVLGSSDNHEIWTSKVASYDFARWNQNLTTVQTFQRRPKWWPKAASGLVGSPTEPPEPVVTALHMDSEGLLWVFIRAVGKNWRAAWPKVPPGTEVSFGQVQHEKLHSTIVEVIDPAAARILTTITIDNYIVAGLSGRRAAGYVPLADGTPRLEILEFEVVRK